MSKQDTEARLAQCRIDKLALAKNEDKLVAELAAMDEVKLRYGDYGIDNNTSQLLVTMPTSNANFEMSAYDKYGSLCGGICNNKSVTRDITWLGSIFDDLEAMAVDKTVFEIEGNKVNIRSGYIQIIDTDDDDEIHIDSDDLDEFILNLRQMQATAKRQAK